jgi:hypothetical protein
VINSGVIISNAINSDLITNINHPVVNTPLVSTNFLSFKWQQSYKPRAQQQLTKGSTASVDSSTNKGNRLLFFRVWCTGSEEANKISFLMQTLKETELSQGVRGNWAKGAQWN